MFRYEDFWIITRLYFGEVETPYSYFFEFFKRKEVHYSTFGNSEYLYNRARTFGRGTVRRGTVRRKKNVNFG